MLRRWSIHDTQSGLILIVAARSEISWLWEGVQIAEVEAGVPTEEQEVGTGIMVRPENVLLRLAWNRCASHRIDDVICMHWRRKRDAPRMNALRYETRQ
jgi:hypothetical protein